MIPTCEIIIGDCIESLRKMPDESVQCVVTSPPYYGLRDYGVDGQIGLEETPAEFITKMVEVFEEVRRVLRMDGTLWMNMGDSYAGTGDRKPNITDSGEMSFRAGGKAMRPPGYKAKDLMGMPWRLAIALQDAGWWLRQDIIWDKPNPMPESVNDRCCKSHEYIFLLSKSARYFYDAEAVKEPVSGTANARGNGVNAKIKAPDGWDTGKGSHGTIHKRGRDKGKTRPKQNASFSSAVNELVSTRHKRSVWRVTTEPCKEAHFATFPQALVRPCILAGTSTAGCCEECEAPLVRTVEKGEVDSEHQKACGGDTNGEYKGKATKDYKAGRAEDPSEVKARILRGMRESKTTGWKPTCSCNAGIKPCVAMDIFGGSGTTGKVAIELGRSAILLELNPEYAEIARIRTNTTPGLALA